MDSELVRRQKIFTGCLGKLIDFILSQGYQITMAEGYVGDSDPFPHRGPHLHQGCHYFRLAQDLNIWYNGALIDGTNQIWKTFGDYWKSLDDYCRYGGDFSDHDHFSVLHPDGKHE
jgi:hypothetical protein